MAGKKQHFIPQHFQRPFLIPDGNEKIWLYRHDLPDGVPVSLKKSAAKEHFYSKLSNDGSRTLDDLITEYEENNLTGKVNSIRALPAGSKINAADIAKIVTHLTIRSAHIREFVNEGAKSMVGVVDMLINSPEQMDALPSLYAHRVPSGIYELVANELSERGLLALTNVSEAAIVRLLYFQFRESFANLKGEASKHFASFADQFSGHLLSMGKVVHTEVLQKSMAPDAHVKRLLKLSWYVEKFEADNAILPDCTSIAFDGENWKPLILVESKDIQAVVLPLAPDRLAVGRDKDCGSIDLSNFNEFAANACFHFFLSNQKSDEFQEWQSVLGGQLRSELANMTQAAMSESLHELLHGVDLEAVDTTSDLIADQGSERSDQNKAISYQISLRDCGDQEAAGKIAARINPIITTIAKMYSMSGLDGITFARDYKTALNDVTRGVENVDEIIPFEEGDKIGMGMPITILTEDKITTRIVMRECVAADLLSEDNEVATSASAVVLYLLASCILTEIIQQKFPDLIMKPLSNEYEGFLAKKTGNIVETYFSTRISSWVKDHADYYATDTLDVLLRSFAEISIDQNEYGDDGDHEKLYEKVSSHAVEIMKSLARLFAAKAETNENSDIRQDLKDFLIAHQLFDWALLYEKDLNTFYLNIDNWSDYDECLFVNRHLERLLVQFGIVTDQLDSGELYVHVQ